MQGSKPVMVVLPDNGREENETEIENEDRGLVT
jgi:hypothetical protein